MTKPVNVMITGDAKDAFEDLNKVAEIKSPKALI